MLGIQVDRLKKDSRELQHFMRKLEKKGETKRAYLIQRKIDYLGMKIEELEEVIKIH